MDTFFEQIVAMRKGAKEMALIILILVAALIVGALLMLLSIVNISFASICFLAIAGVFFGAYKLIALNNVEFEYILTNGEMDIDKITNRSSRKRQITFSLKDVLRIEKYDFSNPVVIHGAKTEVYCNKGDENACFVLLEHKSHGKTVVVFSPNDRMLQGMSGFIPRIIGGDFFKK